MLSANSNNNRDPFVQSYFQPSSVSSSSTQQQPQQQQPTQPFYSQQQLYPTLHQQPTQPEIAAPPQQDHVTSMYDVFSSATSYPSVPQQERLLQQQQQATFQSMQFSTPFKGAQSMQANTPMSVSPAVVASSRQVGASPSAMTPNRQQYQKLNPNYPNTVTVFGFPPETSSPVLSLFRNYGNIVSFELVGNCNWMNIEFENNLMAQMALSRNGMIIDEVMIGVVPMKQIHESGHFDSKRMNLSGVLSPMKKSSPFTASGSSGSRVHGAPQSAGIMGTPFPDSRGRGTFDETPLKHAQQPSMYDSPVPASTSRARQSHSVLQPAPLAQSSRGARISSSTLVGTPLAQAGAAPAQPAVSVFGKFVESFLGW